MQQPSETPSGHKVVGARAKSVSVPGARAASSQSSATAGEDEPEAGSAAAAPGAAAATTAHAFCRERLIELYRLHNPANVARVDVLLKKYRGQEEFLYRQVCAKYNKTPEELPKTSPAVIPSSTGAVASNAGVLNSVRSAHSDAGPASNSAASARGEDGRHKSVLARPGRSSANDAVGKARDGKADAGPPVPNGVRGAGSNTSLLARIDFLLLGDRTGFFERAAGCASSGSAGSSSQMASESGESSGSGEEDARGRGVAAGKSAVRPPAGTAKSSGPPPLPASKKRSAASAASRAEPGAGQAEQGGGQDGEDSEMSDDMLADALAAKLQQGQTAKAAGPRPPPRKDLPGQGSRRRDGDPAAASGAQPPPRGRVGKDDGAEDNGVSGAASDGKQPAAKSKAWGAPPPVRNKRGQGSDARTEVDHIAAKPKAKASSATNSTRAAAGEDAGASREEDGELAPPLFDQWLACLKFLVGWSEAKCQDENEVKGAFCEHLKEEGIESSSVVDQLCASVVPLLLDVRRIDAAVVRNVPNKVLKSLKTVQVSILRIVAYELCRELDAKLALKKKKDEDPKFKPPKVITGAGATYLASDISSLAKVVQHFRFDKIFSQGLLQLFTALRGRNTKNGGSQKTAPAETSKGPKKRKTEVAGSREASKEEGSEKKAAAEAPPKKRQRVES